MSPEDDQTIGNVVALAATAQEAEAYMAGASGDGVAECLQTGFRDRFEVLIQEEEDLDDAELGDITVGALNVGAVGDEAFAYRITVPISVEGLSIDFIVDQVAVRVGRSLAGLQFESQFSPVPIETITEYATLASSRLPVE